MKSDIKNELNNYRGIIWLLGGMFTLLGVFLLIMLIVENDPSREDLDGQWVGGDADFSFEAVIVAETIQIEMNMGGTRGTYWLGDFTHPGEFFEGDTVISQADTEALAWELLASGDDTKQFVFEGDVISFEFGILGTTRTVELVEQ